MAPTPTTMAQRVLYRFTQAGLAEPILDAEQLKAEIERLVVGPVRRVRVLPPTGDDPTTVRWNATTSDGCIVVGVITMRTAWADGALLIEPVVELNAVYSADGAIGRGTIAAGTDVPRQLLDDRLQQVVVRLRRLVTEIRVRPDVPAHELAEELRTVIELADIEE